MAPCLRDLLLGLCPYSREGRGFMPRPSVVVVCFASFRLLELEVSGYRGAVCCGHRQAIALAHLGRTLGCRPVVDELTSSRIVAEARTARRHCLDRIFRVTTQGAASDRVVLYRGDRAGAGQLGAANALEEF